MNPLQTTTTFKCANGVEVILRRERLYGNQPGKEQGWITHGVTAHIQEERVGFLTFSWIPDFDTRYPDPESCVKTFGTLPDTERMERYREFHSRPFVAYVSVLEKMQRQGLGAAIYQESARWLAEEWDSTLAQGDPNDLATRLWDHLKSSGEPVRILNPQGHFPRYHLDYRGQNA